MIFLPSTTWRPALRALGLLGALLLAACGGPGGRVPGQLSDARASAAASGAPSSSDAMTARDYRRDAARHIYRLHEAAIYRGKLPPLLYAVGTLQVHLDARGQVQSLHWLRAPQHAPDAVEGIERIVLGAAPYPVSARLGPVVWTDTWLWDQGGRFQIDTLSEGQLQAQP